MQGGRLIAVRQAGRASLVLHINSYHRRRALKLVADSATEERSEELLALLLQLTSHLSMTSLIPPSSHQ